MSVCKPIVKFVVFLESLIIFLSTQLFKNLWAFYNGGMGFFFSLRYFVVFVGPKLGLGPALAADGAELVVYQRSGLNQMSGLLVDCLLTLLWLNDAYEYYPNFITTNINYKKKKKKKKPHFCCTLTRPLRIEVLVLPVPRTLSSNHWK